MAANTKNRGRPPISNFCVDCFREGLELPEAGPKIYGSYCARHFYKRQKAAKFNRSNRKVLIWGVWSQIPDEAREHLAQTAQNNSKRCFDELDAWGSKVQIALHRPQAVTRAFEFDCVYNAINLGRKLTIAEEDEIIAVYDGSRAGTSALRPIGPEPVVPMTGPVLLPDPKMREKFRAEMWGGPTTEGEPSFTQYYQNFYQTDVPVELREELDPNEEVLASDGQPTPRSFLEQYEKLLSSGRLVPYDKRDLTAPVKLLPEARANGWTEEDMRKDGGPKPYEDEPVENPAEEWAARHENTP